MAHPLVYGDGRLSHRRRPSFGRVVVCAVRRRAVPPERMLCGARLLPGVVDAPSVGLASLGFEPGGFHPVVLFPTDPFFRSPTGNMKYRVARCGAAEREVQVAAQLRKIADVSVVVAEKPKGMNRILHSLFRVLNRSLVRNPSWFAHFCCPPEQQNIIYQNGLVVNRLKVSRLRSRVKILSNFIKFNFIKFSLDTLL